MAKKVRKRSVNGAHGIASKKDIEATNQFKYILLFAFGLVLFFLVLIKGKNLWHVLHDTIFGLFGFLSFFLGILNMVAAILFSSKVIKRRCKYKFYQFFVLFILLCAEIQTYSYEEAAGVNLVKSLKKAWQSGVLDGYGGGVIGEIVSMVFRGILGKNAAIAVIWILIFVFFLIITSATLFGFFKVVFSPVKNVEKGLKKLNVGGRFNIDVPIDSVDRYYEESEEKEPIDVKENLGFFKNKDVKASNKEKPKEPILGSSRKVIKLEVNGKPVKEDENVGDLEASFDKIENGGVEANIIENSEARSKENLECEPNESLANLHEQNSEEKNNLKQQEDIVVDEKLNSNLENLVTKASCEFKSNSSAKAVSENLGSGVISSVLGGYKFPSLSFLNSPAAADGEDISSELKLELSGNASRLIETLNSFGVKAEIINICRGPSVTRYEIQPSAGVKLSKITNLADDISLNLAAGGVIIAPVPGKKAIVGIEVPNKKKQVVYIREVISSAEFLNAKSPLTFALGKDIAGNVKFGDIAKMPHILIAGATGSGKSVCVNSLIVSLLYKSSPSDVRLLMIDPKVVELGVYNGIPHLLVPVVTEPKKASGALSWAVAEMMKRYKIFAETGVRDMKSFNSLLAAGDNNIKGQTYEKMPHIVIIIDELADLMMVASKEVESSICRLAQMARAAGMHLVIATQRPSVDVITGLIKANIPSRIAFTVSSQVDSRTIIDMVGAEKLLGKGDMLYYPMDERKPVRVQGCFLTDGEIEKVVDFIKQDESANYSEDIIKEIDRQALKNDKKSGNMDQDIDKKDPMLMAAIEVVVEGGQASTSYLQRRLKLGYSRAARIMDELEEMGVVGPQTGSKPRDILITKEQYMQMNINNAD